MEMLSALVISAFLSGLAGSIHCAGMCGPLAGTLSFFVSSDKKSSNVFLQLAYNLGRFFSYSLIGLLLGFAGEGTNATLAKLLPLQEAAAWIGVFALGILGIFLLFGKVPTSNQRLSKLISKFAKPILGELQGSSQSLGKIGKLGFYFGLLTGLLPCGILYPAFVTAFASGSPIHGAIIMSAFFLGTFPLLYLFGIGFKSMVSKLRGNATRYAGGFIVVVSILLILFRFQHQHGNHEEHSEPTHNHSHHH
ncbi:sulfite exporter TauE/SafE family protein [Leptospira wolffii]|uniref:Sulfite exporter TauE/SafE family protein n=1 Tax=Leptospira wolffii TaxID=409998 RepID=A0ABV5BM46_9LEPT|nr:sulfite exporter TauE/SafE family protein [Leptospira wolffii]TGL55438.1 sulfite exporter TauE/SafE family protein [Leptospira wolffii]